MKEEFTCCICNQKFNGFGNNPWPLCERDDYESRCCDECNSMYVIPARIDQMFNKLTAEEVQEKYLKNK